MRGCQPEIFILDIDGVMTDGTFYYSIDGKIMKKFGPDDHDALKILSKYMKIQFITSDTKGYNITKRRIEEDMGMDLECVDARGRDKWLLSNFDPETVIYMGDGFWDSIVMKKVKYSIAPFNSHKYTKRCASYVTKCCGCNRAVTEACFHILKKFFHMEIKDLLS